VEDGADNVSADWFTTRRPATWEHAFLSLYRDMPGLRDHDQLLPYRRAAVINRARSVLRAHRRAAQAAKIKLAAWQARGGLR